MTLEDQILAIHRNAQSAETATPIMMQEGGAVPSQEQMQIMGQVQDAALESSSTQDPNADIAAAIEEMMMQAQMTDDPAERRTYEHLAEAAVVGANAPMAEQAIALAAEGRGDDTALAHLRPGEVVLPPEAFEDEGFERAVQQRFEELDIDPAQAVVGLGIASLNPITGLEEFGFFKKIARGVKKVVKKVVKPLAQVAQFIPGPWQPIAALVNKAYTVYDVAKGNISPLALLTVAGPGATGGSIGDNISNITKAGTAAGGGFFKGLGSLASQTGTAAMGGVGNLMSNPLQTVFGGPGGTKGLPGLLKTATFSGQPGGPAAPPPGGTPPSGGTPPPAGGGYTIQPGDTLNGIAAKFGTDAATLMANNPHITDPNMIQAGGQLNVPPVPGAATTAAPGGIGGLFSGGGQDGVGNYGAVGDFVGGITDKFGLTNYGGTAGGGGGGGAAGGGGGGGFGGKDLAAMGLAGLLGKLAYDEAKNAKGVAQTPMTTMNAAGRYNIEAEIARRMGDQAPNPTEFGLLPANTFPTLSGGRPTPAAGGMRYGGQVMRFAEGGNVDMKDFERMVGDIEGPGTEVSDDIPAMLSDGEFVMTGQAVRGAGAFQMKKDGGIITLEPLGEESRDKGTKLMYDMMQLFKDFAGEPA